MAINEAQVTQKKQQQAQVYVSTIYLCVYFYGLRTILNFSYKVLKIVRNMQKSIETCGNLCTEIVSK